MTTNPERRRAYGREAAAAKAAYKRGDLDELFRLLERAHILGQPWFGPHTWTHWWMLKIGWRRRDPREIRGQISGLPLEDCFPGSAGCRPAIRAGRTCRRRSLYRCPTTSPGCARAASCRRLRTRPRATAPAKAWRDAMRGKSQSEVGNRPTSPDERSKPSTSGCRNRARTISGTPTAPGRIQNAICGSSFQRGRFLPLST